MKTAGLIVAAGRGERARRTVPKQYEALAGRPMLAWSIAAMQASPRVDRIVVALNPEHIELAKAAARGLEFDVVVGGDVRTASVRAGLEALSVSAPDAVLIHDAARPGLSARTIESVLAPLSSVSGAAPALAVADALKRADADGRVTEDAARVGVTDCIAMRAPEGGIRAFELPESRQPTLIDAEELEELPILWMSAAVFAVRAPGKEDGHLLCPGRSQHIDVDLRAVEAHRHLQGDQGFAGQGPLAKVLNQGERRVGLAAQSGVAAT